MAEVDKKEMETSEAVGKAADSETKGSGKNRMLRKRKRNRVLGKRSKNFGGITRANSKKSSGPRVSRP